MSGEGDFLAAYETPRLARLAPNLFAACFPLMKLLPARFMLERAEATGHLQHGGPVAETTSGTFGLALALLAAVRGFDLTLVSAASLIDDRLRRRLEFLGAIVHIIDDPEGSGAQRERLAQLHTILEDRPETFWPRQYDNPDNRMAYGRLAEWITREIGRVDCLVGCVGSGGSLCGTGGFLREVFPDLTIIAVDTHRSVLFGHAPGRRLLRGLGNSLVPSNLRHEMVDEVHWVGAFPAFASAHRLHHDHALFMGPTSGAAALVAAWYARKHPDAVIFVILPDEGHRYQHTVYDDGWLAALEGWPAAVPDEPETLARIEARGEGEWTRLVWHRKPLATMIGAERGV
ncbi:PLP-dependent cysteine synthase family protein [Chelativorans intermedius]|uniref:PLP-dependent cysteine synthase family protein n=2 Tax=Chelativorans intermedius TaxID=515947 RepID=A0ABV6DAW9_9HYPH|nr:pyridoxal-phosphate dependent enzyme [Chelativorans intermedius]MCT9000166.1 pyridoxal-phosphate dependent enzyme [Chelativorans intermedius]